MLPAWPKWQPSVIASNTAGQGQTETDEPSLDPWALDDLWQTSERSN